MDKEKLKKILENVGAALVGLAILGGVIYYV